MSYRIDEAKALRIRQSRRAGATQTEIALAERISITSVRRVLSPGFRERANEAAARSKRKSRGRPTFEDRKARNGVRKPLYDPRQHAIEPMGETAERCGDPRPGRRELVANAPRQDEQVRRQPWSPVGHPPPTCTLLQRVPPKALAKMCPPGRR